MGTKFSLVIVTHKKKGMMRQMREENQTVTQDAFLRRDREEQMAVDRELFEEAKFLRSCTIQNEQQWITNDYEQDAREEAWVDEKKRFSLEHEELLQALNDSFAALMKECNDREPPKVATGAPFVKCPLCPYIITGPVNVFHLKSHLLMTPQDSKLQELFSKKQYVFLCPCGNVKWWSLNGGRMPQHGNTCKECMESQRNTHRLVTLGSPQAKPTENQKFAFLRSTGTLAPDSVALAAYEYLCKLMASGLLTFSKHHPGGFPSSLLLDRIQPLQLGEKVVGSSRPEKGSLGVARRARTNELLPQVILVTTDKDVKLHMLHKSYPGYLFVARVKEVVVEKIINEAMTMLQVGGFSIDSTLEEKSKRERE